MHIDSHGQNASASQQPAETCCACSGRVQWSMRRRAAYVTTRHFIPGEQLVPTAGCWLLLYLGRFFGSASATHPRSIQRLSSSVCSAALDEHVLMRARKLAVANSSAELLIPLRTIAAQRIPIDAQ
jgi:hypothetical protein